MTYSSSVCVCWGHVTHVIRCEYRWNISGFGMKVRQDNKRVNKIMMICAVPNLYRSSKTACFCFSSVGFAVQFRCLVRRCIDKKAAALLIELQASVQFWRSTGYLLSRYATLLFWFIGFNSQYVLYNTHILVLSSRVELVLGNRSIPTVAESLLGTCSVFMSCLSWMVVIYVSESHTTTVRVLVPQRPHDQLRHIARRHYGGDRPGPQDAEPTDHPRRTRYGLRKLHVQRLQHGASLHLRLRLRR